MTEATRERPGTAAWADMVQAVLLLAVDPIGLGGANLRASPGPIRDQWVSALREYLPDGRPFRRMPATISEQRLLGGLDLAATLGAGRAIVERGLLAESDGGVVILAMAERISGAAASHLAAALDDGVIRLERDGLAAVLDARIAVIALDEGLAADDATPVKLLDRLAFHLDFKGITPRDATDPLPDPAVLANARERLASVTVPDSIIEAITSTALALGIASLRATLLAVKAARAAAALAGRSVVLPEDATLAASLVLGPRATQIPQAAQDDDNDQPEPQPSEPETAPPEAAEPDDSEDDEPPDDELPAPTIEQLADMLLEAAQAAIPADLLAKLQNAGTMLSKLRTQGRVGIARKAMRGGRPIGTASGDPRQGGRLNIIETLRAAAPWQILRRREVAGRSGRTSQRPTVRRIEVRRSDFRITRTQQRSETATIFVVDASGSSALNRLAEAKGAVELLLADCYVRRDQVAVLAFRGTKAELLLPPSRSLVRAKRCLAGLPGGGPTPLATAIESASELADSVRRKGLTPTLIFLTDGRANIARDGSPGRDLAQLDAYGAARALRALQVAALLIDTSPKPQLQAERLASEMAALYLPLPYADATRLSKAVRAVLDDKPSPQPR